MAERLIARQPMSRVDIDSPGQVGRVTVELLVEEIAPAAYCLSQNEAGSDNVHPAQGAELFPSGINDEANGPADYGPENAQPSTADDCCRVLQIEVPLVNYMV